MGKKLGIAVVGCGYWGSHYLRVFNQVPGARIVAVCDQRSSRLLQLAPQFGEILLTTDLSEALSLDTVDAVVVATEATAHFEVVRRCLLAGKHVLVEKPIATSVCECDELTDLAKSQDLILMVGHTFLYNPAVRKVKEYMQNGDIGRVYYLYARRTNMGPIRRDVDALWDLAPHDISIFNYLLNSTPVWVSAVGAKVLGNGHQDVGFIALGYPDDIVGHIHVSWADPCKVRELVVVGSERRLVFDDLQATEPIRVFEKGVSLNGHSEMNGDAPYLLREGAIISPHVERSEPLRNQCQHFLECIECRTSPLSDGAAGRDVVMVLKAIDESVAHRGVPVELKNGVDHDRNADLPLSDLSPVR